MSKNSATFLSFVIIVAISYCLGYFFSDYRYITLPLSFFLGFFGVEALSKTLVKVKSK